MKLILGNMEVYGLVVSSFGFWTMPCFLIMKFSSNYAWQIKHQLRLTRNWRNERWNLYWRCPLAVLIKWKSLFFSFHVPRSSIVFLPMARILRCVIPLAPIESLKLIFSDEKLSPWNEKHRRKWKMSRRRTINVIRQGWVWSHGKQGVIGYTCFGWGFSSSDRVTDEEAAGVKPAL